MTKPCFKFFLGIDVAKASLSFHLLRAGQRQRLAKGQVANSPAGLAQLLALISPHVQDLSLLLCVFEATGHYTRELGQFLHDQGLAYACVNPARIKFYAQEQLSRTKTDAADAHLIARYAESRAGELLLSKPLSPNERKLQASMRLRSALVQDRCAARHRLETCELPELRGLIQGQIDFLSAQIDQVEALALALVRQETALQASFHLLCNITGIGQISALGILAEIADKRFGGARQFAAYAGLSPHQRQSGSSLRGKTRLSKIGNSHLRSLFYFPAQSARRHCPPLKLWADSLAQRGLAPKAVIGAVMRKLAHIVFGVLKHQAPFNPQKISANLSLLS